MKVFNARIKVFNLWWWMYVVLTFLLLAVVTAAGNTRSVDERYRLVLVLSVAELIILRLYKFSLKDIRDDYNYYNELPCYLCNQSTLLCILASVTRSIPVMAFCVSVGTLGAVLAYVMPDSYNRDQLVFSKQAYGFYGYHGLLIVTCLSFYTLHLYEPVLKDCLWAPVGTLILAGTGHMINTYLRKTGLNKKANYVYTYTPENKILQTMWNLFPVKLWYMLPVLPIFTVYSFVFFLILRILHVLNIILL